MGAALFGKGLTMTVSATAGTESTHISPVPRGELARRLSEARSALKSCNLCEWRCGINRTKGEPAPCCLSAETYTFRRYLSLTDEMEIVPTLRVYLAGCNFRCRFCNTGPMCFEPDAGEKIEPSPFAAELTAAARRGAKTIDLLGGEPSLHPHTILEIAAAAEEPLPLVLDTNLYMTPEVIDWLEGVLACAIGDFKFGNDRCAQSLAGVPRYWEVVTRNLLHFTSKGIRLIVRHLLMPGHVQCCFKPVADWMASNLPEVRFHLACGYVPCWKAQTDSVLGRMTARSEQQEAEEYLRRLGLNWHS